MERREGIGAGSWQPKASRSSPLYHAPLASRNGSGRTDSESSETEGRFKGGFVELAVTDFPRKTLIMKVGIPLNTKYAP